MVHPRKLTGGTRENTLLGKGETPTNYTFLGFILKFGGCNSSTYTDTLFFSLCQGEAFKGCDGLRKGVARDRIPDQIPAAYRRDP